MGCKSLGLLLLVWSTALAADKGADSLIAIIRSIPSHQALVYPHFPAAYRVPVAITGTVADEMNGSITALGVTRPQFEEVFENRLSRLEIANADYSYETRELVGGILNPLAMTDIILASFIRLGNDRELRTLAAETIVRTSVVHKAGSARIKIVCTPRGERFCYQYDDRGAYTAENWLSLLEFEIDSTRKMLMELTMRRHTRVVDAAHTGNAPPPVRSARISYSIRYEAASDIVVPCALDMSQDSVAVLSLRATYRRQEGRLVFDRRSLCMRSASRADQCLDMVYGTYRFSAAGPSRSLPVRKDAMGAQMKQAATLLRTVQEDLRTGMIDRAIRRLNECVERFPGTPQAMEARRLLQGLPVK